MTKSRLEAFSDGVLAIVITIMVLELHTPEDGSWRALWMVMPTFASYLLSFVYVGIYWNNHHHMFQLVDRINGAILWANLHLLFWLTLIPFATRWVNEADAIAVPVLVYGIVLLGAAFAYTILQRTIIREQGRDGSLMAAMGSDWKGKASPVIYVVGLLAAWLIDPHVALALYAIVALMWLVPDRRVERYVARGDGAT